MILLAYWTVGPWTTPHTQASQCVHTINVHGTATTDALSAASSECERWVNLVLDSDQGVQHHRTGLVQVERVGLHLRLRRWLVRVPSVDVEGLDLRVFVRLWLLDCRCVLLGYDWPTRCSSSTDLASNSCVGSYSWSEQGTRWPSQASCRAERCHCG